jgi:hypothetical protein
MDIEQLAVSALRPYPKNARTHSRKQIRQIAKSIERFGFCNPVLIDDDNQIIAGHGRAEAAKLLNMEKVPAVRLSRHSTCNSIHPGPRLARRCRRARRVQTCLCWVRNWEWT